MISTHEPRLKDAKPELRYQCERLAYFALDKNGARSKLVFNRTITLKNAWAKESQQAERRLTCQFN